MNIEVVLLLFLLAVCGVCMPAYYTANKKGFKIYALWVGFVCVVWCLLICCTDIIC